MAAGLPVAMVGPEASEPAQTILQEEIGFVVDPDQGGGTERLVENLLRLCDDDGLRAEQGARARAAFLEALRAGGGVRDVGADVRARRLAECCS